MNLRLIPLIAIALALFCPAARAEEPPPLTREAAKKILESMDYSTVEVVAVLAGFQETDKSSHPSSTVIGLARRDAKDQRIVQSFLYDRSLGWFHYEFKDDRIRLWNEKGYSEVKLFD